MAFGRDLIRGSLDLMALAFVSGGECYGYQILAGLRDKSNGQLDLKAGTLYPILHKLENAGCLASRWEKVGARERKWYSITPKGRDRLVREQREWLDYADCVRGMLRAHGQDDQAGRQPATT